MCQIFLAHKKKASLEINVFELSSALEGVFPRWKSHPGAGLQAEVAHYITNNRNTLHSASPPRPFSFRIEIQT